MNQQGDPAGKDNHKAYHILQLDPWLEPYADAVRKREKDYADNCKSLLEQSCSLADFANGHHYFGFHLDQHGWVYREWAPAADALYLIGDFNKWNRTSHPLTKKKHGEWEIRIPGADALKHASRVKVIVHYQGEVKDRIPLYIRKVIQDPHTHDFSGQIWMPEPYVWQCPFFRISPETLPLIYEVHVGMAQEDPKIGTYREFADQVLPRAAALGYHAVQLMAVMEHPYYASFGYHVSNYFAASSWFGTPEDLKYLVDKAHQMGLAVLMDLVQSHAVKNTLEGINAFDGTNEQFFHEGDRGNHHAWDSKLFNYGKHEVIHFLLSSIKYWLEEFHFDGFRFDGVTSMLYLDHGLGTAFDRYDKYFSDNTDPDAVIYLQLANQLIHEMKPDAWTIAEDMSGMPGMCLPVEDGGIGFDYRLAMGMPDYWIKLLEQRDEDWSMQSLWHELTASRPGEKQIAYAESHDQALVGDKTLIFRMADQDMYWHMSKSSQSLTVDRAVALHKMIRMITLTTGSEGYLTFMGNEFGHPEWIDFPRQGNNWSFAHCRRQWYLADDQSLWYYDLNQFEKEMLSLVPGMDIMREKPAALWIDTEFNLIAYKTTQYVFIYNFHPVRSIDAFPLPIHQDGAFRVKLSTDDSQFGGQNRIDKNKRYHTEPLKERAGDRGIKIYVPCRTAMILQKEDS